MELFFLLAVKELIYFSKLWFMTRYQSPSFNLWYVFVYQWTNYHRKQNNPHKCFFVVFLCCFIWAVWTLQKFFSTPSKFLPPSPPSPKKHHPPPYWIIVGNAFLFGDKCHIIIVTLFGGGENLITFSPHTKNSRNRWFYWNH